MASTSQRLAVAAYYTWHPAENRDRSGQIPSTFHPEDGTTYYTNNLPDEYAFRREARLEYADTHRLCCTKPLMSEVPLSPDGFIPRFL